MALIVQKFGGSSVKDRDRIFNVARIVANTHNAGNDVVVVVSAQGDTTDDLIAKAGEITHNPSAREMDMLLASGEQISIALLAMALNELGCHAISLTGLTGSDSGIPAQALQLVVEALVSGNGSEDVHVDADKIAGGIGVLEGLKDGVRSDDPLLAVGGGVALGAAGGQRQHHHNSQTQCEELFHKNTSFPHFYSLK